MDEASTGSKPPAQTPSVPVKRTANRSVSWRVRAAQAAETTVQPKSAAFWGRVERRAEAAERMRAHAQITRSASGRVRVVQGGGSETNRRKH